MSFKTTSGADTVRAIAKDPQRKVSPMEEVIGLACKTCKRGIETYFKKNGESRLMHVKDAILSSDEG